MTDSPPDGLIRSDEDDDAVRAAIVRRYRQVCAEWTLDREQIKNFQTKIAYLETRQRELAERAKGYADAGRQFGVDVIAELESQLHHEQEQQRQGSFEIIEGPQTSPPIQPPPERGPAVKDVILEIARQAFPQPVQAKEIRQELLNRGISTHEKTAGMTCYRWSLDGLMRRSGRNWYFVPESERSKNHLNGHAKRWRTRSDLAVRHAE